MVSFKNQVDYLLSQPIAKYLTKDQGLFLHNLVDVLVKECDRVKKVRARIDENLRMYIESSDFQEKVGNFSIVMVSANDLLNVEPPCSNLIVIENEQSGFMVPDLPDTSIIFGCGNNLAWAKAAWLKNKTRVFYWGDIVSWGYFMLSQFRLNAGREVNSLMMDLNTIEKHAKKMVAEPMSKNLEVSDLALTCTEAEAYVYLRRQANNRLEQEKVDQNFVLETIQSLYGR